VRIRAGCVPDSDVADPITESNCVQVLGTDWGGCRANIRFRELELAYHTMIHDSAPWDEIGTLERVARAGSGEKRTILLENAPLWALVARAIETERYATFMGQAQISMHDGFSYRPEAIRELAALPDRWTEPHPIRVPP
jgi:hypothetical protein